MTSVQRVATFEEFCFNYINEDDQQRCEKKEQEIRDAAKTAAAITATTATTKPKPAPAPETTTKPAPAPETTFGDGLYKVGEDIKPGSYRTSGSGGGDPCYYARLRTDDPSNIIANNVSSGPMRMTVRSTDGYVEFSGGCTWKPA